MRPVQPRARRWCLIREPPLRTPEGWTLISRLICCLLAACAAALLLAAPASADHSQTTFFEAPRDLKDPATIDKAFARMDSLGVTAVRQVLTWRDVAPNADSAEKPDFDTTDPNSYNWSVYDPIVQRVKARGWKLLLTVSGPVPKWATESRTDQVTRPKASEFTQFMTAVARHYQQNVDVWSIWNEPNQPQFLMPQYDANHAPASPAIYRALYKGALKAFDSLDMKPTVLFGETSPRGTGSVVAPLTFMRSALCLSTSYKLRKSCGRVPMAGYAHHAYTTRGGPAFKPSQPNDVTIGVLSRLTRALSRAAKAGAIPTGTKTYLTEFGIQSTPDTVYGVSYQRQAEYRSISERIAYDNPSVVAFSQYLLTDDRPTATSGPALSRYGGFESGLISDKGTVKPAYAGFRLPLTAKRSGSRVGLWGLVRPAGAATSLVVEYRNGSKGAFRKLVGLTANSAGYFRATTGYRAGREYRVRWTAPGGETFRGAPTRVYTY